MLGASSALAGGERERSDCNRKELGTLDCTRRDSVLSGTSRDCGSSAMFSLGAS